MVLTAAALITGATILFTLLKPFIDAWIIRSTWTPKQKSLVAWATSIILGTVFVLLTGGITSWPALFVAIPAIYGYSEAIFKFIVKNLATKFADITTPGSAVITPADPGTVTVTTDATIEAETNTTPIEAPITVTTSPEVIVTETPAKG